MTFEVTVLSRMIGVVTTKKNVPYEQISQEVMKRTLCTSRGKVVSGCTNNNKLWGRSVPFWRNTLMVLEWEGKPYERAQRDNRKHDWLYSCCQPIFLKIGSCPSFFKFCHSFFLLLWKLFSDILLILTPVLPILFILNTYALVQGLMIGHPTGLLRDSYLIFSSFLEILFNTFCVIPSVCYYG